MNFNNKIRVISINSEIKEIFLDYVKRSSVLIPEDKEDTISKTSYYTQSFNFKLEDLYKNYLDQIIKSKLKINYRMNCIWYQIYNANSGSYHEYHTHCAKNCHISAVYYLSLFDKSVSTEFIVNDQIKQFHVNEGDLILFDARLKHRSPPNYTSKDKIIVSFNLDCEVDN